MTMALAVAMVACSAATSVKGETGAQGAQGEQGVQGPPGTVDNEPPMHLADKPFEPVYLALAGSGKMNPSDAIDPSGHFSDAEKAALTFEVASSDEAVATAKIDAGKITVTGKTPGTATITVSAYDGVNTDPATAPFDVEVVAKNIAPSGISTTAAERLGTAASGLLIAEPDDASAHQKLHVLHYISEGKRTIATALNISAGPASDFEDNLIPEIVMGASGAGDDIAVIDVVKDTAKNRWNITVEPVQSGRQNVEITMKDKFGVAQTWDDDTDATTPEVDVKLEFAIWINTPPSRVMGTPMPDKILVGVPFTYYYQEYFNIVEVGGTAGPGDKTAPDLPADFSGADCTPDPAIAATAAFSDTSPAGAGVVVTPSAANAGEIVLTITCSDRDDTVSDTAKITIRG